MRLTALFLLLFATVAFAQDKTVISRQEIEQRKTPFVIDLLRTVPGVQVVQFGSAGQVAEVFLRGAFSNQVKILIDGVELQNGLNLENVSTAGVERIEILRGPLSAVYGSDAMGGVINIITTTTEARIHAHIEGGSDHTGDGAVQAGVGSDKNNVSAYYGRYDTDGQTVNDDYRNTTKGFNSHVEFLAGSNIGLILRYTDANSGIVFPVFDQPSPPRVDAESDLLLVPFTQRITNWWNLQFRYSRDKQERFVQNVPFGNIDFNLDLVTRTTNTQIQSTWKDSHDDSVIAGFEYESERVEPILQDSLVTRSVFARGTFAKVENLSVAADLRYDQSDEYGSVFSPRVDATYRAMPSLKLHGSIGAGFRAPFSLTEIVPVGSDLNAEKSTGFDFGAEYDAKPNQLALSATVFANHFHDLILFDPGTIHLRNSGKANTAGIELAVQYHPLESLDITGTYTFTHTNETPPDEPILLMAQNTGSVSVTYRWNDATVHFVCDFVGKRPEFASVQNNAYQSADLVFSYDVHHPFQIYGRVTNLFDQRYSEALPYPAPDRAFFAGLQILY